MHTLALLQKQKFAQPVAVNKEIPYQPPPPLYLQLPPLTTHTTFSPQANPSLNNPHPSKQNSPMEFLFRYFFSGGKYKIQLIEVQIYKTLDALKINIALHK